MSSSYSRQWTPDVFVSFQDDDNAVEGFTSTLFAQLKQVGIGYFSHREDVKLCKIHHARFALVVFTMNYAKSSRFLDELVKILLRRGVLVVIPIFHGMDPAEVRKFEQGLDSLHKKERDEKKKEWRRALAKVEGISGYELYKDGVELELIQTIVERLVNEIRSLYSHKVFGPFGGSGKTRLHSDKINGIDVVYTEFVESLTFKVPDETDYEPIATENTYKVQLRVGEHITSFSGRFKKARDGGPIRINALTFQTNQARKLGPIDREEGEYFAVPLSPEAGKVIEFFGSFREENKIDFLTSIGARVELLPPKKFCPVGLFGSRRGSKWDDGNSHTAVKRIRVGLDSSGNRIRSIAFQYEEVEESHCREPGSDTKPPEEFIINDGDEYLSSISGYCTYDGITSLTFLTNKKNTKIIGDGKGTHFSSPATGCKIVGFYGWSDKHLHGIGAYYKPIPDLNPIKSFGPFGRAKAWDDGKFKGVKKIYIAIKDYIRHIKIVYEDSDGNYHTIIHGDCTGEFANEEEILSHYPEEYLISISGYTQEDGSIRSLIFDSNERRYCPCGTTEGEYFGYPSNETRIIGFYGTWGKTLDSIGVYAEPIRRHASDLPFIPFKGSGGTDWDDGKHSNVIGYRVTDVGDSKKKLKIESITFMYDNNGSLVEGSRHGGGDAGRWVMLDFPEERLICITGQWCQEADQTIIHDLKINTTHKKKPPLTYAARGQAGPNTSSFSIPEKDKDEKIKDRRIIGFVGKADTCLNSIGAHFQPYDDQTSPPP